MSIPRESYRKVIPGCRFHYTCNNLEVGPWIQCVGPCFGRGVGVVKVDADKCLHYVPTILRMRKARQIGGGRAS